MASRRRVTALVTAVLVLAQVGAVRVVAAGPVRTSGPHGLVPHHTKAGLGTTFQLQPSAPLDYLGGPVLHTNETFVVFWDPDGRLSPSYRGLVTRYLEDVAADSGTEGNVYSVLNQYSDTSGSIAYDSTFAGSIVDDSPYPSGCPAQPGFPDCMTDEQLAVELDAFLFDQGIARPANRAFLVVTAPGLNTCFLPEGFFCRSDVFCGYHTASSGGHGAMIYANLPYPTGDRLCDVGEYPNGNEADPLMSIMSHEHREMINDPYPFLDTAWIDEDGQEGSDKCAEVFGPTQHNGVGAYNQVINGHPYLIQAEWSNLLGDAQGFGCVMNGTDRSPTAAFSAAIHGSSVALDARLSGDPDAGDSIDTYFWTFGDGVAGFGATPQHSYAAPGTYVVTLIVTDQHAASATAEQIVTVTQPTLTRSRAWSANLEEIFDLSGSGSGSGNASRLGPVTEHANLFWDFTDYPAAFGVSGIATLEKASDSLIAVSFDATLTDVTDPPEGFDFTLSGTFVVLGGYGPFAGASGAGTITGTCTSDPTSTFAVCKSNWRGTVGWP